ncbi:hypothetical protein HPB50_020929 [Hyalomma asiaticum]|uniref:Uncharacterized protein n=1 Tax=Hyalomma asiaticum TaxID=266040 RepID=A0ACB7TL80_HYAAI|nr:hypothetical protein HPB50_020929 [Hyalomma asiaticum]
MNELRSHRLADLRLLLLLVTTAIFWQCPLVRAQAGPDSGAIGVMVMNYTSTTTGNTTSTTTTTTTTAKPDRAEELFNTVFEKFTRIATREFYPFASELIYDPRLSPGCIGSLMKIATALRTLDIWAVQMMDATGRPPAGMMQGRLSGYGAYEQCLAVKHDEGIFQGKYCMVHLRYEGGEMSPSLAKVVTKFANYLGFEKAGNVSRMYDEEFLPVAPLYKFGLCVPSLCEADDLQAIMDRLTNGLSTQLKARWCAIEEPVTLDKRQTLILCIFAVWISFILFGTGYDIYRTMLWGDEYTDADKTTTVAANFIAYFKRLRDDFLFSVQVNSFMAVETFLVITGFLSGYLVTKAPRVHLSPVVVIIIALFRRYVRLIVPMLALLGFMYLIPALIDGPAFRDYWPIFEGSCTKNWWKIFTMTENYLDNIQDLCMPHFWYVAVDFQLAIVSTVILAVILPRWPKASLWLMAIIAAATCLATGIQVYIKDALPFNIILTTDVRKLIVSQTDIYIKAHYARRNPFHRCDFRLSRRSAAPALHVSAGLSLAALLGVRAWSQGRDPERIESTFYAALHRASWAMGTGWVMYACATNRGGLVNKLLSWPCFYPLGRLAFSVYLVHVVLMACNSALSREFIPNHPFLHAQMYVSVVMMAYALASIMYLLVECPVAGLDNLVFSKLMPKETILKVMQGKATTEEVKYIEALAQAKGKKALELALSKQTSINGFPDSSSRPNSDDKHQCYTNGALNTDLSEDTQPNGAVMSIKF